MDCVFYVANGIRFAEEAAVSAASVKRHMPDIQTLLFAPVDIGAEGFDLRIFVKHHPAKHYYLEQVYYFADALEAMHELGFNRVILADTDTYFCAPVYELFEMADRYDFMGAHAPARITTDVVEHIPDCFPELNIGVNPMRNCHVVRKMFRRLCEWYSLHVDVYGNNDQGPLRHVLWNSGYSDEAPSIYVLPPEYNLRFPFPCFASKQVKILHGRSEMPLEHVAEMVNQEEGMRVWTAGTLSQGCPREHGS